MRYKTHIERLSPEFSAEMLFISTKKTLKNVKSPFCADRVSTRNTNHFSNHDVRKPGDALQSHSHLKIESVRLRKRGGERDMGLNGLPRAWKLPFYTAELLNTTSLMRVMCEIKRLSLRLLIASLGQPSNTSLNAPRANWIGRSYRHFEVSERVDPLSKWAEAFNSNKDRNETLKTVAVLPVVGRGKSWNINCQIAFSFSFVRFTNKPCNYRKNSLTRRKSALPVWKTHEGHMIWPILRALHLDSQQ